MRRPIFVRPLTDAERHTLERGLRSSDALVLRRCQIRLARARGARAPQMAAHLGCDDQTVLDALPACNADGLAALPNGSSRPHRPRLVFSPEQTEQLRALLHRRPRAFGHPTSRWTLALAAQVSCAHPISPRQVSDETIRQTLQRLGVGWKRATHWSTRPDPGSASTKARATA